MKNEDNAFPRWIKDTLALIVISLLVGGTLFCQNVSSQVQGSEGGSSVGTPVSSGFIQLLTEEERAWLSEHPVIRVVQDPSWPPVEFADDKGEPSGISNDYLKLIEHRLGVKFERVLNLSWQESYARLKRWDIDMTTCVAETQDRSEFWAFTKPYMNIPIVILTQSDVTYVANMRELEGKKVAVVDGYVSNEWIQRDFPDIPLVKVKNVKEGLDLLQKGDVFAFVDNLLVIGYQLAKLKLTNLKVAGWTPYVNAQSMAVRKDWAILAGILQKALDSIPESKIVEIYKKWVLLRYEYGFDYKLLGQALALFAVILAGLLVWNRKLSREIRYRKEAEAALKKSENFLNNIIENIPIMIFMKDASDLRFVKFNRAGEELLGYSREELLGKNDYDIFPKHEADFFTGKDREVLQHGQLVEIPEERIQTRHSGERLLHTKKISVFDDQENPQYLLGISEDITERKQAEQEKEALQAQLFQSQKLEVLGTLVGGIAHDFNNMLQIILGYSQFLLEDKKKGDQGYKELQTIIETGNGGADLVKKLLAFGQQGQVFPVPLDLNHQISQLANLISRTLPQVVQIDLDLIDGPATIRGDHSQIDQLVMNLAINASEAMPNGGCLKIATTTVFLDDEYCRRNQGAKPGNYVMLSVSDTGRGMDKATLARIFDPFFSTKEMGSTRGTGLGLSVVKGIAQQQGGHVICESEPGKGTEFKVYFPTIEAPLMTARTVVPTVQSGGAETILVVEDNSPVAELERKVLANAGYTVIVAASGQEALKIYQKRKEEISLVILDLLMPEMSGRDCLMELLKIHPSVKVLIASGYSPEDELHKQISPLVKGFVHKPFGIAELLNEVRCVLGSD